MVLNFFCHFILLSFNSIQASSRTVQHHRVVVYCRPLLIWLKDVPAMAMTLVVRMCTIITTTMVWAYLSIFCTNEKLRGQFRNKMPVVAGVDEENPDRFNAIIADINFVLSWRLVSSGHRHRWSIDRQPGPGYECHWYGCWCRWCSGGWSKHLHLFLIFCKTRFLLHQFFWAHWIIVDMIIHVMSVCHFPGYRSYNRTDGSLWRSRLHVRDERRCWFSTDKNIMKNKNVTFPDFNNQFLIYCRRHRLVSDRLQPKVWRRAGLCRWEWWSRMCSLVMNTAAYDKDYGTAVWWKCVDIVLSLCQTIWLLDPHFIEITNYWHE